MARHREKQAADQAYVNLATKASVLADAQLKQHETGEMHLYAAMADSLQARLYSLRWENRATARVGVRAREHYERALALDPSLADAYLGLGLYNYYVDTLSTMARILRFMMGIPGGSKEEGIRQLHLAMLYGELTPAVARFYLAINLHNYDQRYEEALQVLRPLVEEYPQNPLFQHGGAGLPPEDPIAGAGGAEWHGLAGALKDFPPAPGCVIIGKGRFVLRHRVLPGSRGRVNAGGCFCISTHTDAP